MSLFRTNRLAQSFRQWRKTLGSDISTPSARKRARLHFNWFDHGILRIWWSNFSPMDGGVCRSNQPSPAPLCRYRKKGIKTVLTLRGETNNSPYLFEREACDALGLELVSVRLNARNLPERDTVLELEALFKTLPKPFVMHCKSGSDRAGFASALYLMLIKNAPVNEARRHLALKYAHAKWTKAGVLDFFFERYSRETATNPISFRQWVMTRYDRAAMMSAFASKRGIGNNR